MALSVSPAVKVFALLGVVVALVMGGGMFVLGGSQEAASAALPDPATLVKNKKAAEKAGTQKQEPASKKATKKEEKKRTVAQPPAPAKKKPAPRRAAPRVDKNGLPMAISRALATHDVVVVSLYGGGWKIDPIARDEAAAGARAAGAGFVGLDVTRASSSADALMLKFDTI